MSGTVDKKQLLKPRLPEETVDIDGVGTVRVRALSRADVLAISRLVDGDDRPGGFECRLLARALVDPVLTEDEVAAWQAGSPADEIRAVAAVVNRLSGLTRGTAKGAYRGFESDPDERFRVLPGGEAGHDGGSPA